MICSRALWCVLLCFMAHVTNVLTALEQTTTTTPISSYNRHNTTMATELFFPWMTPDLSLLVFASAGRVDEPRSCAVQCKTGYFRLTPSQKCQPHSTPTCAVGEYLRAGDHERDAQCSRCSGCAGHRRVANCSLTANDLCESCGALGPHQLWESSMQEECLLACQPGFELNRQRRACEVCTTKCAPGWLPPASSRRDNCSHCEACNSKPTNSEWLTQDDRFDCAWQCEPQHALVGDSCVKWANVFDDTPSFTPPPTTCAAGETLVDFQCAPCFEAVSQQQLPLAQDLGRTWSWLAGCHWQCRHAQGFTAVRAESGRHWTCVQDTRRRLMLQGSQDSWVTQTAPADIGLPARTSAQPARSLLAYALFVLAATPVLLLQCSLLVHCMKRCRLEYATLA
jgi:hypothetical protein